MRREGGHRKVGIVAHYISSVPVQRSETGEGVGADGKERGKGLAVNAPSCRKSRWEPSIREAQIQVCHHKMQTLKGGLRSFGGRLQRGRGRLKGVAPTRRCVWSDR